nr:NADP-dependent alkenal double bond reductase P2-like [Nicotiana tomentosiformis]
MRSRHPHLFIGPDFAFAKKPSLLRAWAWLGGPRICEVRLLKNEFGFDDAFNYKKETDISIVQMALTYILTMWEAPLLHMNANSKIVASGMISQYNLEKPDGIHNLFQLITKRITMEGFHIVKDHLNHYDGFVDKVAAMLECENIYYKEDQTDGLENAAAALIGIFHGENVGKGVIVVAED